MNKCGSGSFIHGIQYPLINFNAANTLQKDYLKIAALFSNVSFSLV